MKDVSEKISSSVFTFVESICSVVCVAYSKFLGQTNLIPVRPEDKRNDKSFTAWLNRDVNICFWTVKFIDKTVLFKHLLDPSLSRDYFSKTQKIDNLASILIDFIRLPECLVCDFAAREPRNIVTDVNDGEALPVCSGGYEESSSLHRRPAEIHNRPHHIAVRQSS